MLLPSLVRDKLAEPSEVFGRRERPVIAPLEHQSAQAPGIQCADVWAVMCVKLLHVQPHSAGDSELRKLVEFVPALVEHIAIDEVHELRSRGGLVNTRNWNSGMLIHELEVLDFIRINELIEQILSNMTVEEMGHIAFVQM